jgi:hypothetical protein
MHLRTAGRRVAGVLASTLVGAGTLVAVTPAAHAAGPEIGFTAYAYGTSVYNADRSAMSGPTAYVSLACTTAPGKKATNKSAAGDLGRVGKAGATVTTVESSEWAGSRATKSTSTTAGATLLGGLIKAKAITAETKVKSVNGAWKAENSSTLADLTILGKKIDVKPGANTRINVGLPGVGKIAEVILNEQQTRTKPNGTFESTTTALHVKVLPNSQLGNKFNIDVIVGRANAQLTPPAVGYLGGRGFATKVTLLNGAVQSGPTSLVAVPCLGGVSSNRIASGDLGDPAEAKGAWARAEGSAGDPAKSKVEAEIAGVNLLGGLITADAIKSVASAKQTAGGPVELSDKGSEFVNLKINGKPVLDTDIGPNTKLSVLGVDITLNKVRKTSNSITVTQIEIVIKSPRSGLPVNSKVEVAYASASILPAL